MFKDNRAGQVLQQDVSSLVHTLVYDEQGQPKVKLELVKDVEVLLSAFLRKVRTVSVAFVLDEFIHFGSTETFETLRIGAIRPHPAHCRRHARL